MVCYYWRRSHTVVESLRRAPSVYCTRVQFCIQIACSPLDIFQRYDSDLFAFVKQKLILGHATATPNQFSSVKGNFYIFCKISLTSSLMFKLTFRISFPFKK